MAERIPHLLPNWRAGVRFPVVEMLGSFHKSQPHQTKVFKWHDDMWAGLECANVKAAPVPNYFKVMGHTKVR